MSDSGSFDFVVTDISILEWYDGVIRGIAESEGKCYLFILAAWDPASGRKAYVLVKLDLVTSAEMKRLCTWKLGEQPDEDQWRRLDQIYDQYLSNYKGPAYLSTAEPVATKSVAIIPITADHLDKLRDYDIEQTTDLNVQKFWFGML